MVDLKTAKSSIPAPSCERPSSFKNMMQVHGKERLTGARTLQSAGLELGHERRVIVPIFDEHGNPRIAEARHQFLPMRQEDLCELVRCYEYWRDFNEYMLLLGTHRETGEKVRIAVKCSKRGNDVYARRLNMKLGFLERVRDVKIFEPRDFDMGKTVKTNLLWFTLTYDSKRCSLHEAWQNFMGEYNKFITNLRNRYGKIEVLFFPQAFPDDRGDAFGYPHGHGVMLFRDSSFSVFPHMEKDKQGRMVLRYRVREKDEISAQGKWHSFIDVQAMSSMHAVVNYCKKYAQDVCYGDSGKASLNCATLWLYRKKSYTLSSGFRKALSDLIRHLRNSKTSMIQTMLSGEVLPTWEWSFLGIRSSKALGISGDDWVISMSMEEFDRAVHGYG